MYNLAFLENMADAYMKKEASLFDQVANTVNFAANAKVLNDVTNKTLSKSLKENNRTSVDENDRQDKSKGVSVLITGDLKDRIPEEQRQRIIEIAKRISEDRKKNSKK